MYRNSTNMPRPSVCLRLTRIRKQLLDCRLGRHGRMPGSTTSYRRLLQSVRCHDRSCALLARALTRRCAGDATPRDAPSRSCSPGSGSAASWRAHCWEASAALKAGCRDASAADALAASCHVSSTCRCAHGRLAAAQGRHSEPR